MLSTNETDLPIKEDRERGFFVQDLTEQIVTSVDQVLQTLAAGERQRHFGRTDMNEQSSRSHCIFRVVIESKRNMGPAAVVAPPKSKLKAVKPKTEKVLVSTLNFVDLAGSERLAQTGAVGKSAHEGRMINKSLLFLGIVISKLSEGEKHVPFRDSKLTRILQSSLGGNSRTAVVVCCSPALSNTEHTISTLRFGGRCVKIRNQAVVNEVESEKALIHQHQTQIEQLKFRLSTMHAVADEKDEEETLQQKMEQQDALKRQLEDRLHQLQHLILASTAAAHARAAAPVVPTPLHRAHSWSHLLPISTATLVLAAAPIVTAHDDTGLSWQRPTLSAPQAAFYHAARRDAHTAALTIRVEGNFGYNQLLTATTFTLSIACIFAAQ